MNDDFDFVKDALDKVSTNQAKKVEIRACISDFKSSVIEAFKEKYGVTISFSSRESEWMSHITRYQQIARMKAFPGAVKCPAVSKEMNGDVIAYVRNIGVKVFGYAINPLTGYPVNLMYIGKTIECETKDELIGAMKEAYGYALDDLTQLCKGES